MFRSLCLLFFVGACSSPGPNFWRAEAVRVVIDGSTFDLRREGDQVEAIRVNYEPRPRFSDISARAEIAIERETGCPVTEFRGDVALLLATLDCTKPVVAGEHPVFKAPKRGYLECVQIGGARTGDLSMLCS